MNKNELLQALQNVRERQHYDQAQIDLSLDELAAVVERLVELMPSKPGVDDHGHG
jgi:hypothetical protein